MLSHTQRKILAILKNRTWRRIGLLTHHSEEKRVSELCRKLEAEGSHFIIPPLAAILPTHEELTRVAETFQSVRNHLERKLSVDLQFLIKQL